MITVILTLIAKHVAGVTFDPHHHHHHHMHSNSITSLSITPTLVARDATEDSMPTLSTGEPTLSITHIPVSNNPYVYVSNLPSNLVFIVIGAIFGAILLSIILYRITTHFKYNRQAMNEKETYYTNLNEILNYKSPYSRNSSILDLNNNTDLSTSSTSSNQGRSYRDSILGNNKPIMKKTPSTSRNSMFISPTMDFKTFELPLYQKQHNASSASLILRYNNNNNNNNNNTDSSTIVSTAFDEKSRITTTTVADGNESSINGSTINGSFLDGGKLAPPKRVVRAPSLYLEDLLNDKSKEDKEEGV
ncbi:unnamed protein product [Candida dubliniensis CD36]|uniref:Uncharacterized protein n=1 Tax=Candida dubliniensis (strain CD36 / ATCC MYA-646 / CBS 7987 / NCPF 3949 / NRRL Y-17841) TaxID=573826 RepID=B9WIH5_CANDC|nr:uncharacterized protein CD36_60980 [Candida dubliniensis CD36]CAX41040.1 unnamed protein product [Candida dubliniensis CD36]